MPQWLTCNVVGCVDLGEGREAESIGTSRLWDGRAFVGHRKSCHHEAFQHRRRRECRAGRPSPLTTMTQPPLFFFLFFPPLLPLPLFKGAPGVLPPEKFCNLISLISPWNKKLTLSPYFLILSLDDFRDVFCVADGVFGRSCGPRAEMNTFAHRNVTGHRL